MKKFAILLAGLGIAATAVPATAIAAPQPNHGYGYAQQGWQNINARQARLYSRIDQGARNGSLSRREATRLKTEFRQIAALETRYRRSGGLQQWERRDLDRRFDALSAKIRIERNDRNDHRGPGHRR